MLKRQRFWVAVLAVLLIGSFVILRNYFGAGVTANDELTPTDVDSIQQDLNPNGPQLQVQLDAENPYLAEVYGLTSTAPIMRCASKTYFDKDVDHKTVSQMSNLTVPGNRTLACWTSSSNSASPSSS